MHRLLSCLLALPATLSSQTILRDIDPRPGFSSGPEWVVTSGNRVFFGANDGVSGRELWTSDGTTAGTRLLADINPGPGSSSPQNLVAVQGGLAFAAPSFVGQGRLYLSDGTGPGTALLTSPEIFGIGRYASGGDRSTLYFTASTTYGAPSEVYAWRVGGATRRITDFHATFDRVLDIVAVNGERVWFTVLTAASVTQLFVYQPGSLREITFPAGTTSRQLSPNEAREVHGKLYFPGFDSQNGLEPWVADPNTATARMVGDVHPGVGFSNPVGFVGLGADVVFVATTLATGYELFKYQPGAPAPMLMADVWPGPNDGIVYVWPMVASGRNLFFVGYSPATGQELWRSDGTAAGTSIVRDVDPGTGWGYTGGRVTPVCDNGSVLFQGTEPVHGAEMWITDGTAAGTRMLFDLVPGAGSGLLGIAGIHDGWAALLGTTWFFLGTTAATGTEPFAFEASPLRTPCATCPVAGCPGTNGIPRLSTVGQPTLGNPAFACRLQNARAATAALLLLDGPGSPTSIAGGCTLFTGPTPWISIHGTDGAGEATRTLPIPNDPWLLGAVLRAQWTVVDPNGAFDQLLSFSNGCFLLLGN